jgi:hypothetical protein
VSPVFNPNFFLTSIGTVIWPRAVILDCPRKMASTPGSMVVFSFGLIMGTLSRWQQYYLLALIIKILPCSLFMFFLQCLKRNHMMHIILRKNVGGEVNGKETRRAKAAQARREGHDLPET